VVRIGIVCNGLDFPGHQAQIIKGILSDTRLEIALLVTRASTGSSPDRPVSERLNDLFYSVVTRAESILTKNRSDVPHIDEMISLTFELKNVPIISIDPNPNSATASTTIDAIQEHRCDVLLQFDSAAPDAALSEFARLGVWRFDFADGELYRGGPAGFWEWYDDHPYSGVTLRVLGGVNGVKRTINRAIYSTYRLSWNENRRRMFDRSRTLMLDCLDQVAKTNSVRTAKSNIVFDKILRTTPSIVIILISIVKYIFRIIFRTIYKSIWKVQFGIATAPVDKTNIEFNKFDDLHFPDKKLFWADPFIVNKDSSNFVFVEELYYKDGVGTINCLEFRDGELLSNDVVLKKPYHLSYPFIFRHDDTYFMCPETSNNRTIDVYRCVDFPLKWEHQQTLMDDIYACETSIHELNGKWWLFTNIARNSFNECNYELHLFSSDDPLGRDWVPHPLNPVVQDAGRARNGGGVMTLDNQLYRMAQGLDGRTYGSNFIVNRIVTLNETEYEEKLVQKVFPNWHAELQGTHHFVVSDDVAVVDFWRPIFKYS